jgi:putative ABC transport system permease protein
MQESKLLGLDQAVIAGRMLGEGESSSLVPHGIVDWPTVPVIATDSTLVDQSLHVIIERLQIAQDRSVPETLASSTALSYLSQLGGSDVDEKTLSAQDLYDLVLKSESSPVDGYWTVDAPQYQASDANDVEALPVVNPSSIWSLPRYGGQFVAPAGNEDAQFRLLHPHFGSNQVVGGALSLASIDIVGQFDPHKIPNFSSLSNLPLETYFPTEAVPADQASQKALGSAPLLPTMNLGGYVAQPSLMLTTLEAAEPFLDPAHYGGADPSAPISAIRVNVVGATGPDKVSQERIRRVAETIQEQTGLSVDVTAGSSPHPVSVRLPAGQFGRPALVLLEGWTQKDTAIVIISAIDRKSVMIFTLVLLVTGLFIANAAFASVRSRRKEIGILLCMGWPRRAVFASMLGEVGLIGTAAGLVGAGLSLLIAHAFALRLPVLASLLAAPAAVLVSLGASLAPAFQASKGTPLDAVRPPLSTVPRPSRIRGLSSMALGELRRLPGSTLLGASSLLVGVSALTFLVSVNLAFRGTVVGTLLGGVVSFEVRGVDYLSVGLALLLGGLSVADVLFVNLQERAAEIATLRSLGWGDWQLGRFIALEGMGVGVLGTCVGVLIGSALSFAVGGLAPGSAVAVVLAVIGGVLVAVCASVIPALHMRREIVPRVLAEE